MQEPNLGLNLYVYIKLAGMNIGMQYTVTIIPCQCNVDFTITVLAYVCQVWKGLAITYLLDIKGYAKAINMIWLGYMKLGLGLYLVQNVRTQIRILAL